MARLANILNLNGFQKYQSFSGTKGSVQELEGLIQTVQYLISGALVNFLFRDFMRKNDNY